MFTDYRKNAFLHNDHNAEIYNPKQLKIYWKTVFFKPLLTLYQNWSPTFAECLHPQIIFKSTMYHVCISIFERCVDLPV